VDADGGTWASRCTADGGLPVDPHPGDHPGPGLSREELLGRSIGLWIDKSLQLTGQLNDGHIAALLELARKRQQEPIDLADDRQEHSRGHDSDSE
jgi:hypothetical protein